MVESTVYASDLDSDFPSEIVHFAFHLRSSDLGSKTNTAQAQLSYLKKNYLIETFPNVAIILRIYLTLPVANTEGERSFSALKRVKTIRAHLLRRIASVISVLWPSKRDSQNLSALRILLINLQQRNAENTNCKKLFALAFFCVALSVLFIIFFVLCTFAPLMEQCEHFDLYITF